MTGVFVFLGRVLLLGGVSAALAEAAAAIGCGVLALLGARSGSSLERFGLGLLLGWGVLGAALFGLALAGLFYPAVILAT